MFLQTNVAVPSLDVMFVPVAVISSQVSEHSRSTTTLPSLPEDVPVTLMSAATSQLLHQTGAFSRLEVKEHTVDVRNRQFAGELSAYIRRRVVTLVDEDRVVNVGDCMMD